MYTVLRLVSPSPESLELSSGTLISLAFYPGLTAINSGPIDFPVGYALSHAQTKLTSVL